MTIIPIVKDIKAKAHNPIYTVHRYFARRPHNVIGNVIDNYLKTPKSLVLDPFGGGGTTLIEAISRGHRVLTYDTSDLACFVMEQEALMASCDVKELTGYIKELLETLVAKFGHLYRYGGKEIYWLSWVTYQNCPICKERTYLHSETSVGSAVYRCVKCTKTFRPSRVNAEDIVPFGLCLMENESMFQGKAISPKYFEAPSEEIKILYDNIIAMLVSYGLESALIPRTEIPDCNLQRESALHKKGIKYYEQFIPRASRGIIDYIAKEIMSSSLDSKDKRRVLFVLSASLRYCSRFSSINGAWRGATRPLEWAKSNFWTPYSFVEVNPIIAFAERWLSYEAGVRSAKTKFGLSQPVRGRVEDVLKRKASFAIINKSSEMLEDIPEESVDLIVTDPPYGSYLHYCELSGFWTAWLSRYLTEIRPVPDRTREAVPARKKGYPGWKTFDDYEDILALIFKECFRVLKKEGYCVVTFNNREPEAWIAFLRAVKRAGFCLPANGVIFQDGVENYKNTIDSRRAGAIHGNFIYSFQKANMFTKAELLDWRSVVEGVLKTIASTSSFISNSDLYASINLALLPKIFHILDIQKKDAPESIADLTTRSLEKSIEGYFARERNLWIPK